MTKAALRIDWASYEAADYAVKHWHYSEVLPCPPLVKVGVWEDEKFIGVVLFSRGANPSLGTPHGLTQTQVCELTRVALDTHKTPVSRIVAIAMKFLKQQSPELQLIVSYADPRQGHHGGIYQAGGWIYDGDTAPGAVYVDKSGREWHNRMVSPDGTKRVFGKLRQVVKTADCTKIETPGKHRYLMPLTKLLKRELQKLAKPYPKRAAGVDGGTPDSNQGETVRIRSPRLKQKTPKRKQGRLKSKKLSKR